MEAQRKAALWSVFAAIALIALKLGTGLATHSLGLISEAAHSGTDLIAALLTFFALGVAVRPADVGHQYGHGKAEHLAALAEGAILVVASVFIVWNAISRLVHGGPAVHATWFAFLVIGLVICIDISRTVASRRAARAYSSPALASNALHFGSDLGGSVAVLVGLVLARAGHEGADSVAALFVAALVLIAAARLMRRNVDVLMDRAPADAEEAARQAIVDVQPPVQLRRLRMRQAAGRVFADVVIGVDYGAAVGQGHAAADAVERAVQSALPEADVVVHVEPVEVADADVRERAHAAALNVPRVREVHNVSVVSVDSGTELSLHLKLPGDLSLEEAHGSPSRSSGRSSRPCRRCLRCGRISSRSARRPPATRSRAMPRPCAASSAPSSASIRRSCASSTPTRGSSPTSRSGSAPTRSRPHMPTRAGSRS